MCASQHQLPVLPRVRDGDGLGVLHPHHSVADHLIRDMVRDDPLDTTVSLGKRNIQCGIVRFFLQQPLAESEEGILDSQTRTAQ